MFNSRRSVGYGRNTLNNVGERRSVGNFIRVGNFRQNQIQRIIPQVIQRIQNQGNGITPPPQPQTIRQIPLQPITTAASSSATSASATSLPQEVNNQRAQGSAGTSEENTTTLQENAGKNVTKKNESTTTLAKSKLFMKGIKITRGERIKRLNKRLKKVLLPKNAIMVLNEMIGNTSFELSEINSGLNLSRSPLALNFKAAITIDGKAHEGVGKTKTSAKAAAAEAALQYLVVSKMNKDFGCIEDEKDVISEEKMETQGDFSICHLASFALYKLFNSWEDGGKILSCSSSSTSLSEILPGKVELKPSKKLPDNPHLMNPVMLLNQMRPDSVYEEICKTGTPPNLVFTVKVTVGDLKFVGNGPNKKASRKSAAIFACKQLFGIEYPETSDIKV